MKAVLEKLKSQFPEDILSADDYRGDLSVTIPKEKIPQIIQHLKENQSFEFMMDICGVDHPKREKRFDVVYHLFSLSQKKRIRLKTAVGDNEAVPTITGHYKGANWYEREAYDMFGIQFHGHPNLKRILCHQKFVGHPLRKDYNPEEDRKSTRLNSSHSSISYAVF